ncbi:MAG: TerB family tellurite resistance protein [Maribacter sp.]|uniref:TerB family tellurite resistance protein n=1 Tax=Maribacter sp. TaxID=1897614 RepID=UPI003298BA4C
MSTYEEKLSILSEMITFAKVDNVVKEPEYKFLWSVASQLGITQDVFDALFEQQSEHLIPKTQAERILQFHRLVLLMNVDQVQEEVEVRRLHEMGLGMGLPPSAIDQVLSVMHKYPNNVVPPEVLIAIFKAYDN